MRHVSRTHRVALVWLFDTSNLDPINQVKFVDTLEKIADVVTKGSFTREKGNRLVRLFNKMDETS